MGRENLQIQIKFAKKQITQLKKRFTKRTEQTVAVRMYGNCIYVPFSFYKKRMHLFQAFVDLTLDNELTLQ